MVILKSDSKDFGAGRRLTLIKFPILYLVVEFEKSPQTETPQVTSPLLADYCVRGTRTQPLICVGCSVHYWVSCAINKGGFFETAFVVDTHLPRLYFTSKTLSTVCFLTVPGPGCSKLG